MNLLKEGIDKGYVIETEQKIKLNIDGLIQEYIVYKIKLDFLFYNDQNDRIATWISRYKAENNIKSINHENLENYNSIIQKFIIESNPEKNAETKKNIETFEQLRYGIVLKDGRIIDGNRRFTCLRQLAKENPKFNYFEAVILDKDIENNAKEIKMLELRVQIGEEERVDYNPIDRLVGVYNDLIKNKLLTRHEYAISINAKSDKEVEKLEELAILLEEFLESIGKPEEFYIARDLNIDGPLRELHPVLKKMGDSEKTEALKYAAFANLWQKPDSDMTRFIRKFKEISKHPDYLNEYLDKTEEIAENILDSLSNKKEFTTETIKELRSDEETKESLNDAMDSVFEKTRISKTRNKPVKILSKILDNLDEIDVDVVLELTDDEKEDISKKLDEVQKKIMQIRDEF